jgi:uncharacterized protein DUF5656
MSAPRAWPNRDRLSVLTATIVLAYALARFIDLPARVWHTTILGSSIDLRLDGPNLILLCVAVLISAGSETLMRSHPYLVERPEARALQHWVLPGATALALGVALNRTQDEQLWWLELGVSVLALLAVLVAEYIAIDPNDTRRDAVAVIIAALIYALALTIFALLYSLSYRAAVSASLSGIASTLLAWRGLKLRVVPDRRAGLYAGLTGLICAETFWALTYWRLTPSAAALLVAIPFYVSLGLAQQHLAATLSRRVWLEYGLVSGVGLAIGLGYAWLGSH